MYVLFLFSSPFLFMNGDDRLTCHMGAYAISGDVGEA